tara:strand:- start:548 stop:661 length:114 start_codon:yes stop_codon:yes gene_type:complete
MKKNLNYTYSIYTGLKLRNKKSADEKRPSLNYGKCDN